MKQIAKIVVDVPVMQTNRPFDYLIPPELVNQLEKGMRVEVPFGARNIQGFIVDIVDQSDFEGELKEVVRPLDLEPVLNEELLQLGEDMADQIYSFRIHCYQTMLPPMLKAKYDKEFVITDEIDEDDWLELFEGSDTLSWDKAVEKGALPQLLKWRKKGLVDIRYLVKNQAKAKKIKGYRSRLEWPEIEEELASLHKNAKKNKKNCWML